VAPSNACGLAPQCGCAANQTCDVTNGTTGAVSCISAGTGTLGAACSTTGQCGAGLACAYNTCRPYCEKAGAACTGAGLGTCFQYYDGDGDPVANATICSIDCDPRSPSAACGTNTCIYDLDTKATDCDKAGTKSLYDACSKYNDCKPGLACVNHPLYNFECESWCRVGHDLDCPGLDLCEDIYGANAPKIGNDRLGHCQ
jgi:hypothetical protein